jgi:hypothetical protein
LVKPRFDTAASEVSDDALDDLPVGGAVGDEDVKSAQEVGIGRA